MKNLNSPTAVHQDAKSCDLTFNSKDSTTPSATSPYFLQDSYLLVGEFLAGVRLLWMIEPVDPDHHVAAPRLPHALDAADEGQVGPAGGQEHGAVADADHLSSSHDGLVEELLSFALHAASLRRSEEDRLVMEGK